MGNPSTHHNIGGFISPREGIPPADYTAGATNGTGIDRTGYLSCTIFAQTGVASGSPSAQTVNVKLQDSADNSTFADVTGQALTEISADSTTGQLDVDLGTLKQYIRLVSTVAFTGGSTPAWDVAASVILGGSDTLPVT
jgi:hypothetical protein